jgi:glycosyltransferase involved in cell wall biosynthesis
VRILHVINALGLGGAETLLYRLVDQDRVNEHLVVSLASAEWYSHRLRDNGIPVHHLDIDSVAALPRGMVRLARILRDSQVDVVQCWMYRSNLIGGFVAQAVGLPVVWGIHCASIAPLRRGSRTLAYISGLAARWNPAFIINCSAVSAQLHARIGFSAAPGRVIHNGFDPAAFAPDPDRRKLARAALDAAEGTFLVGSLTRWIDYKDVPTLLRALRKVADRGIRLRCIMLGQRLGPDNDEFMQAIAAAGCGEIVLPLGIRSDVAELARAMDLHVLSSLTEAFPNVVAETMLCATPNVVTNVGDSSLMVGNTGWVVDPGDPDQLAGAITAAFQEWSAAPAKWDERRAAARARIAQNFSLAKMAAAYERVWRRVARND